MKVSDAIAKILKLENVEQIFAYPVNPVVDACTKLDIRSIIVRQERVGLHMADTVGRLSSGNKVGVFTMQYGPGVENSFGAVAQAYGESVPVVILPSGYSRAQTNVQPNFSALVNFKHITKSVEQVTLASEVPNALRRAFMQAKNGRPGPCMVEFPLDLYNEEIPDDFEYTPSFRTISAPDPVAVKEAAKLLVDAELPIIYAGQGVHYGQAWSELKELAELLEAPVTTSLEGKSAFPESHPLSLQSGGRAYARELDEFLKKTDLVFGIGASFTKTPYGIPWDKYLGKAKVIQSTIDTADLHKDVTIDLAMVGDSRLVLEALLEEVRKLVPTPRGRLVKVTEEIAEIHQNWMDEWKEKLECDETPFSPYRVIWDLFNTVDVPNTIVTHDAGSPRDQITPFWKTETPLSFIGWGKTTQLGYGLGLAMGAKLAHPDKLCINYWGDAAIGFTGMDFETAVRDRIPILSILSNNFCMAIELGVMAYSTDKYRSTDISGNYAAFANALGGYGERITDPKEIIPAIRRGIAKTEEGIPVILEFITTKERGFSMF